MKKMVLMFYRKKRKQCERRSEKERKRERYHGENYRWMFYSKEREEPHLYPPHDSIQVDGWMDGWKSAEIIFVRRIMID